MESIDLSNLQAFGDVAAGHEGVLSDPDGSLVIKPCTETEVKFYTQVTASVPELAIHIPTFMGTLQLNDEDNNDGDDNGNGTKESAPEQPPSNPTSHDQASESVGPMFGKKISTEKSIVLGNVASGFQKPNIVDIKLGARLWDDDAPPEKRARLDKVAKETTSSTLGFRIAGMRVWNGPVAEGKNSTAVGDSSKVGAEHMTFDSESGYRVYNKLYGRAHQKDTILDGILEFLEAPGAGVTKEYALSVVRQVEDIVDDIRIVLSGLETRMYSASLLIVYEGDPATAEKELAKHKKEKEQKAKEREERRAKKSAAGSTKDGASTNPEDEDEDDSDDDDSDFDDDEFGKMVKVKLIDFAHASITEGQGPDENVLHGIRNLIQLLKEAAEKLI